MCVKSRDANRYGFAVDLFVTVLMLLLRRYGKQSKGYGGNDKQKYIIANAALSHSPPYTALHVVRNITHKFTEFDYTG